MLQGDLSIPTGAQGADVSAKFHKTKSTALKLAKEHGYDEIAGLIQAAGASRHSAEKDKRLKRARQRKVGTSKKVKRKQRKGS
jgi:hypothetical protein